MFKARLHVPSKLPFLSRLKMDSMKPYGALYTLKRSKVPLIKTVMLTVRVNEPLGPEIFDGSFRNKIANKTPVLNTFILRPHGYGGCTAVVKGVI